MKINSLIVIAFALLFLIWPLAACQTIQNADHKILDADSNDITALNRRGASAMRAEKYETAYNAYNSALLLDDQNHEARYGLAESFLKIGSADKAIENYKMLESVPEYKSLAAQGFGLALLKNGQQLAAEDKLLVAVEDDSSLWRAWNGLAQIYDYQKMWEDSDLAYSQALEHTSDEQVVYNNLGVSYMAQDRFKDAEKAFKQALRYDPDLKTAETNYKLALAMQEKYDEATIENNVAQKAKDLNNAGYAAMLKGDYGQAEKMFLKAIEVSPSFYKAAYSNLQILHKLKNS